MTEIIVYDAMMGSGKTTRVMNEISESPMTDKYIYITPLLSECHRVAGTKARDLKIDDNRPILCEAGEVLYDTNHPLSVRQFKHPSTKNSDGSKLTDLIRMVKYGDNIVSTHALFRLLTSDVLDKASEYTLIVDEVLDVFDVYDGFKREEFDALYDQGILYLDDDGFTLRWNSDKCNATHTRYSQEQDLCNDGCLVFVDNKVVIWELPPKIIKSFKKVVICTYKFDGSYMKAFLDFHGASYTIEHFGKSPSELKDLITIVDNPKWNSVGDSKYDLTYSFQTSSSKNEQMVKLKTSLRAFFRSNKSSINEKLWTCYKPAVNKLKDTRYTTAWLSYKTKATNDYADAKCIAYTCNLFPNPMITKYLANKDITIKQDDYALAEMVQFIWRSAIRKGEPVVLYIPSKRMRNLLEEWLNEEYLERFDKN